MSAETLGGSYEFDIPREKCGVFGIYDPDNAVVRDVRTALVALQHRGQEAAGMAIADGNNIIVGGAKGLVNHVFPPSSLSGFGEGYIGLGHTRYGTVDASLVSIPFQPIFRAISEISYDFVIAHNGNLTNTRELAVGPNAHGSDTEQLADSLEEFLRTNGGNIRDALRHILPLVEGAYSLVVSDHERLIAIRDPHGFRPLSIGRRGEKGVIFASETGAISKIGGSVVGEVLPGELITIETDGQISSEFLSHHEDVKQTSCIIEWLYFSREDHSPDGISTASRRIRMGEQLAHCFPVEADAVVGVPGTGLPIAQGYSAVSGIEIVPGIIKNSHSGRSFIQPDQELRYSTALDKFDVVPDQVAGKDIIVIDDSIVRGTNTGVIVSMLRRAGAGKIHYMAASPPYQYPCFYGVDTGRPAELIASRHNGNIESMRRELAVDSLHFLPLENLKAAIAIDGDPFCDACLTGNYPTPIQINSSGRQ